MQGTHMHPQYYQPLSAALSAPLVPAPAYPDYPAHNRDAPPAGSAHHQSREEEEEEEDDDEEVVEEELDHHDSHQDASEHSSPRPPPPAAQSSSSFTGPGGAAISHQFNAQPANSSADADGAEKRKPGRPRGSRNRKPRAAPGTASGAAASKVPVNSQHPGFYQYPPPPGNATAQAQNAQNQQFYEFQWRALNLCSEFYNAAEELVKAASPIVIAQCYQMGPATKIDPLSMISEAKRVCDNLLANPSQLVGAPPPPAAAAMYPPVPSYPTMPPPPPTAGSSSGGTPAPVSVITNPQSFVMSLGTPAPQAGHPQPYYPPMYAQPGSRYPTTPYYPYAPGSYYPPQQAPPPQQQPAPSASTPGMSSTTQTQASPVPAPQTVSASAPPPVTGTLSTFNAATGNVAPGGQQGTWSEEETERLRRLAEQSRDVGGAHSKGEIEWDWVVHQWGNSRTRHQILLKATSMGLKESTTRGTKRRRENDHAPSEAPAPPPAPHSTPQSAQQSSSQAAPPSHHHQQQHSQPQHQPQAQQHQQPQQAPPPIHASPSQSPATIPTSRPATTTPTLAPNRISSTSGSTSATTPSTSNMPWPMPTVAANTPSPVMAHSQTDPGSTRSASGTYYRPRPGSQSQGQPGYAGTNTSTVNSVGGTGTGRPGSSSSAGTNHEFMYRPNGTQSSGRRQNGI
ncbi:hypothetical protein EIP91_004404 [Steccherinum ochraceum]|uniref:Myb-like domain-containing protein n=1 Tax=Steccherinum ochraceum TaxID=92696 RepID=A0A4R0RSF1_9APHY|nr:hypothetical protein EIP91_004404 [Steccherinum ochraceum]